MAYLILGVIFMLIVDLINTFKPTGIIFNFIDRVILIAIWPISLGILLNKLI